MDNLLESPNTVRLQMELKNICPLRCMPYYLETIGYRLVIVDVTSGSREQEPSDIEASRSKFFRCIAR
jgi:hypothetical protein